MIGDVRNRCNAIHSGKNRCINPGFSWVRIRRSLVLCVVFGFFSLARCVVCYGFWVLPMFMIMICVTNN